MVSVVQVMGGCEGGGTSWRSLLQSWKLRFVGISKFEFEIGVTELKVKRVWIAEVEIDGLGGVGGEGDELEVDLPSWKS